MYLNPYFSSTSRVHPSSMLGTQGWYRPIFRGPIRVTPPPPAVPRLIVTNSRKILWRPMMSRVRSPLYFKS